MERLLRLGLVLFTIATTASAEHAMFFRNRRAARRQPPPPPAAPKAPDKVNADTVKALKAAVTEVNAAKRDGMEKALAAGKIPRIVAQETWGGFCAVEGKGIDGKPFWGILGFRRLLRVKPDPAGLKIASVTLRSGNGSGGTEYENWADDSNGALNWQTFKKGPKEFTQEKPGFFAGTKDVETLREVTVGKQTMYMMKRESQGDPTDRPEYCFFVKLK